MTEYFVNDLAFTKPEPRHRLCARDTLLECFTCAYIECALWYGPDEVMDRDRDRDEIAPETQAQMEADCASFWNANALHILVEGAPRATDFDHGASESEQVAAMAGHDFWLTRNGHGAGFWDGDWPEPSGSKLDEAACAMGAFEIYAGDDGLIYGH